MPDDFIDNVRKREAAEAARQAAIAPPQRPRTATKKVSGKGYARSALSKAVDNIENSPTRNITTNTELFNLGQLVAAGELTESEVRDEISMACRRAGLPEFEIKKLMRKDGGIAKGIASGPRDLSNVGTVVPIRSRRPSAEVNNGKPADNEPDDDPRKIVLTPYKRIKSRTPQWVWSYDGEGRVQLGTLTMFAGNSGTGKSTAMRWFASQLSNGTLPGIWVGNPVNVALYMSEEQREMTIKPSLIAAGADMGRVFDLSVLEVVGESGLMSLRDEQRLLETCLDNEIRALFVDPVLSTFDGKTADSYKNTDVRQHLMPYKRIAEAINGIVVTITHFRKGQINDVMQSLTGSSAFVELPRAVFGFAAGADELHIMEQVKNSAGPTGLALEYALPLANVATEDGLTTRLPRFEITRQSPLSIADIGSATDPEGSPTTRNEDADWLRGYLELNQPISPAMVERDASKEAGISRSRLYRAKDRLKVMSIRDPQPDKPNQRGWALPGYERF